MLQQIENSWVYHHKFKLLACVSRRQKFTFKLGPQQFSVVFELFHDHASIKFLLGLDQSKLVNKVSKKSLV